MSVDENQLKRSGTRVFEIQEYKMTDMQDKVSDEVFLGDDFKVTIRAKANEQIDFSDMTLDIRNDANEFIAHVTNADDLFYVKDVPKGGQVTVGIHVKDICLAPGTYYASVWLGNSYGTFDYIENCIRFSIKQGENLIKRPYPFDKRAKVVLASKWNLL